MRLAALLLLLVLAACGANAASRPEPETTAPAPASSAAAQTPAQKTPAAEHIEETPAAERMEETPAATEETEMKQTLHLYINDTELAVRWEENESVEALAALAPLRVELSMYGGFEQVGPLGARLPSDDVETVTQPGDIVLYAGNRIVIFYGSNAWAYTRLGKVTDRTQEELAALLGSGDAVMTLTFE